MFRGHRVQGASFRRGLIFLACLVVASTASAECGRKIKHAGYVEGARSKHHDPSDHMWTWPISWQAKWPAIVAEQPPADSRQHQDANDQPKQNEGTEDYTRRSTEAAETQAYYSVRQFYVGIASAVVGALAAGATAYAAWAAKLAADAAADATKEAAASNEIARDTAKSELRAYVMLDRMESDQLDVAPYNFLPRTSNDVKTIIQSMVYGYRFRFILKNSGQTPAKNVIISFDARIIDGGIGADFDFTSSSIPSNPIDLGPSVEFSVNSIFKSCDLSRIEGDRPKLYAWGWAEYDDVFKDTPRRRTEFCIEIAIRRDHNGLIVFADAPYCRFNASDEHCLYKPQTPKMTA
jgi:hypothetical protein